MIISDPFFDSAFFTFFLLPFLIFISRILDVTIGTIRIVMVSKGQKFWAPILGFFEILIWLLAISRIFENLDNWMCYIAYAAGFAAGNYIGLILEERLAMGIVKIQIITRQNAAELIVNLKNAGYTVSAFGKIKDIYDGEGITESQSQKSNKHGMENYIEFAKTDFEGLAYLNLVDFDALYGHRRNPIGYKDALEEFDGQLRELMDVLKKDDLLMITADHGNDPTFAGTDHTREYVPLLAYNKELSGGELPIRKTFADIGRTITDNFKTKHATYGTSFLDDLK